MPGPFNPIDVEALERSVNDSAVRVSTIWVSFLIFALYLVVAAGTVTHRQLMLEDPVKLPALNIDLPLVGFFFLAPILFVIFHAYVLVQVLLLARTAATYNEALERSIIVASDRARARQRLANTLFAQIFAGSPREREGLLGAFLRLMAWITLAIAPVLVLLTFQVKFLPYHSSFVTWTLRVLIALDLLGVLLLWPCVLDARRNVTWRRLAQQPAALFTSLLLVLFAGLTVTFPGEPHTDWLRFGKKDPLKCNDLLFGNTFADRLSLEGEVLIDTEKLAKIELATKATGQKPSEGERTRHFRGRDLTCGAFSGVDLRRADMRDTNFQGANLGVAQLEGATMVGARLEGADLSWAHLQSANLFLAQLRGTILSSAQLQGAILTLAQLEAADLQYAQLQAANLVWAQLQGATLNSARLQGADLGLANLEGADLSGARLEATRLLGATLTLANLSRASVWRTLGVTCGDAQVESLEIKDATRIKPSSGDEAQTESTSVGIEAFIEETLRDAPASVRQTLQGELHSRLIADANGDLAGEQTWRDCIAKAMTASQYARKHADYLIERACNSEEYIIKAIYREWVHFKQDTRAVALARGFLSLDGKACPAAKHFDEEINAELRQLAVSEPAY